jgi:uracil-DNA glycosylase
MVPVLNSSVVCSGVLLLNAVLTVRAHSANSHKDQGWEQLTDAVVKHISDNCRNVVFLLWGAYAQKKVAAVDKVLVHFILKDSLSIPLCWYQICATGCVTYRNVTLPLIQPV